MDDLDPQRLLESVQGTRFGPVQIVDSLDSTQAVLVSEGGEDGRVLIADHQTSGRGRQGRSWTAPPGTALLMSVLVRGLPAHRAPMSGLAASLAVARCLEGSAIKWPNDVLVDGRKICGVLGELAPGGGYVVIGMGVNVHQTADQLPPDVAATSLALCGRTRRRDDLAADILRQLDGLLGAGDWMGEYRSRCGTIGERVVVQTPSGPLKGVAEGVRDDGALIVDGTAVTTGDVQAG